MSVDHAIAIASLTLSGLSALGVILGIRWHCKNDDVRAGIEQERSAANTRRIELLERHYDER